MSQGRVSPLECGALLVAALGLLVEPPGVGGTSVWFELSGVTGSCTFSSQEISLDSELTSLGLVD